MHTETLLVEIGTEELPPKALKKLSDVFAEQLTKQLDDAQFNYAELNAFATPRRLALSVKGLSEQQPTQNIERRGPAIKAAYNDNGQPTKALLGFAKSCGVEVSELEQIETDKGAWLYFKASAPGKKIEDVIAEMIETALSQLPIPKPMRWGDRDIDFVRPIHWVVLMYGNKTLTSDIKSFKTSNITHGHRFHAPDAISIDHADSYIDLLRKSYVLADFNERKTTISELLNAHAQKYQAELFYEDSLLEEVTNLVEWPVAIVGEFSEDYLNIPHETLVATMQEDQRYFPMRNKQDQSLLPNFITIANIESKNPETIKRGNERVIKPRFEDAGFFWLRDRKTTLESRRTALEGILFEKQLGSILDKTNRIEQLATVLAGILNFDQSAAARAASLCKCDLVTEMVGEFPKLQGIMGRYYALHDDEPAEIALALEEHYQPLQSGSVLPSSNIGKVIAICDRIDTLLGIFATGKKPTGVKDPYALRRAALGIIRIAIESELDFNLLELLNHAARLLKDKLDTQAAVKETHEFIIERLRGYFVEQGFSADVFAATRSSQPKSLLDFAKRMHAVKLFCNSPHAATLAAANKRIRNILKSQDIADMNIRTDLLKEKTEQTLLSELKRIEQNALPKIQQHEYTSALEAMTELKEPIDSYFENIMVMDEDEAIRNNRVATLFRVNSLFTSIADISQLQL